MNEELQSQIDALKKEVEKLKKNPPLPEHQHNGSDSTRIKIKYLDSVFFKQATINPSNLLDGAGETIQVTGVAGATLGDFVLVSAPYDLQDITVTAYVQANSVVEIRLQNESGSAVNLDSGTWRILVLRKIV